MRSLAWIPAAFIASRRGWSAAGDAALVVLVKLAVSAIALTSGFRAVSDDDYARVVIAQRFVESPSLDPSGTSWLPFPFVLQGIVMQLLSPTLAVARATSLLLGVSSAVVVWLAARWLDLSRAGAVVAAALATALPYSAHLGVATVPEAWTAALVVLGAACSHRDLKHRCIGALALAIATLCRYESWPVAAAFAAVCLWDARRQRHFAAPAALALSGVAAWLLHGIVRHGDALFFVARVADYRRALGVESSLSERLLRVPLATIVHEPEVLVLAALGLVALAACRRPLGTALWRFMALLIAVLVFLIAGDLRDGAPTHHAERAVLSVWMGAAVIAVAALERALPRRFGSAANALALLWLITLVSGAFALLDWRRPPAAFVDRSAEEEIGRRALEHSAERVRIDTGDYGYFAVLAAMQRPSMGQPLDDRDPRRTRVDAFGSAEALRAALSDARWLIVRREHAERVVALGRPRANNDRFVLIELHH